MAPAPLDFLPRWERGAQLEQGREKLHKMSHQQQVFVEVKRTHFVVRLVRSPVFIRDSIRCDHHASAIVSEITVHKNFCLFVIAQQLQKRRHLKLSVGPKNALVGISTYRIPAASTFICSRVSPFSASDGLRISQVHHDRDPSSFNSSYPCPRGCAPRYTKIAAFFLHFRRLE